MGKEMYDGQLELEYTCVGCHKNTYPRRLASGYCHDCIFGGMTAEEIEAEQREHAAWRERRACGTCDSIVGTEACYACGDMVCGKCRKGEDGSLFCPDCYADFKEDAAREAESEGSRSFRS
ncbi:hypothetical protein [Deinococcus wulumuqiensis]|nr:hypothetical protein [Deinococcus wulumuqiensis]QII20024.1 hypothetical protein G6R31_04060 [Deinococcus wulumuqiensis R12]